MLSNGINVNLNGNCKKKKKNISIIVRGVLIVCVTCNSLCTSHTASVLTIRLLAVYVHIPFSLHCICFYTSFLTACFSISKININANLF